MRDPNEFPNEFKDKTVLLVDDEAALRKALAFDFKRKGFVVLEAGSGREAIEVVKAQAVDLILTDIRMPDGDGVELLKRVKDLNPAIPIVMFITGFADLVLEDAYHEGADAVFSKPFDRKTLMTTVSDALRDRKEVWARLPERAGVEWNVDLRFEGFEAAVSGHSLNLGRGGMFVGLKDAFPAAGAKASFRITFKGGDLPRVEGMGDVRWVRTNDSEGLPAGCGIEFTFLDEGVRGRMVEIIRNLRRRSFIPKN